VKKTPIFIFADSTFNTILQLRFWWDCS